MKGLWAAGALTLFTTADTLRGPLIRFPRCRRGVLRVESYTPGHASLAGNMRTIGMLGGLGPESTIDYYRSIIAGYRARRPDGGYPHLIINSLDVDKGI